MSFIPKSRVVTPEERDGDTFLTLPEVPASGLPIRVLMGGGALAVSDYETVGAVIRIPGLLLGDAYFEIDYFVTAALVMPRVYVPDPVYEDGSTLLLIPDVPAVDTPVRVVMGGGIVALDDYTVTGDLVAIPGDYSGEYFEVHYFTYAATTPVSVTPDPGNGDGSGTGVDSNASCLWDEQRIRKLEHQVFGDDNIADMVNMVSS